MSAIYTTGRLLWRPAILFLILPLSVVSVAAMWDLPNWSEVPAAMRSGLATPAVKLAFWRFATLLPAVLGLLLSYTMRELQHTAYAWTLPDLSRRLRFGRTVCGLTVSAALAALVVRLFDTAGVLDIFAWSWLCFALGGVAFDPALSKIESRGVPAILALIAYRPSYVEQVAAAAPIAFAVAASAAAFALTWREFSGTIVRRRPHIPMMAALTLNPEHVRQHWQRVSGKDSEWTGNLSRGGLLSWVRAGLYEGYGGHKVGHVTLALWQLTITVTVGYFTDNPMMVVFFPWIFMEGRLHLQPRFLHPMNRAERASLFFAGSLVESLRAILLGVAGLAILYLAGYPFEAIPDHESAAGLAAMVLAFAAWSPIGHLSKLRGPLDTATTGKRAGFQFGLNMAYVSLAMVTALSLGIFGPSQEFALAAMTALLLATHTAYWLALRRHFARADLIVARA